MRPLIVVNQYLDGVLPEGAQVVTIFSTSDGSTTVLNSMSFHQNQGPAPEWVQEAVRKVFGGN